VSANFLSNGYWG
jgi:hypothetical protein